MSTTSRGSYARVPLLPDYIPSTGSTAPSSSANGARWRPPRRIVVLLAPVGLMVLWLAALGSWNSSGLPAAATWTDSTADSQLAASVPSPSDAPADAHHKTREIIFTPRRPCNAETSTFVPASAPDAPAQHWVSPSPPLPHSAPLSARLEAWLAAPLAPPETWARFNGQTCANPSVRRGANRLQVRESAATWREMGVERVREVREELVGVLRKAEGEGRLREWDEEGKTGTRGVVWTAGNADTFDRVLTSLRLLRLVYSCTLPAQVFHFPSESPLPAQALEFASLNATVLPLSSLSKEASGGRTKSFHLKGAALVASAFDEVLLLDSDNIPVRDVAPLFDSAEFRQMGVVLWPDFFKDQPENAIWSILGVQCRDEWTTESGQLLVRKSAHLDALLLVEHMLRDWRFWFQFSDGDKDLFRYAFLALRKRWAVPARHLSSGSWTDVGALGPENEARFAGHSMLQYGLASELAGGDEARVLFVHANLLKRVLADLHEGNTFGRTLRLRLPASNTSTADATEPAYLVTADTLANVSPLTGIGIGHGFEPSPSRAAPRSVLTRALLERGLGMQFWDAHRGSAYVLAVSSRWVDELGPFPSEEEEEAEEEGWDVEREGVEWRAWVERERAARCSTHGSTAGTGGSGASLREEPGLLPGVMEVVAWADDPDLSGFEERYYGVGRGRAGGTGFR